MPNRALSDKRRPVGIIANTGKAEAVAALIPLLRFLKNLGLNAAVEKHVAEMVVEAEPDCASVMTEASISEIAKRSRFIVTYGGDGTMLAAARQALPFSPPILGVNLGKLGFLADIDADEAIAVVDAVLQGFYLIEKRMTLAATLEGNAGRHHALNDLVINKSGASRVIRIEAYVDGDFIATFLADGLIVSTPTGSTAYSLATGGPVVAPSSDVIIISPIAAHALTTRPIIVPGRSRLLLRAAAEAGSVMVSADGFGVTADAKEVALHVKRGGKPVYLIKGVGPNYFEMLRSKLGWAQDKRFGGASPAAHQP